MKTLEEREVEELVSCAKELISDLDWLVRAYEDEYYHRRWEHNVADAVAGVKFSQKFFNRQLRAYNKIASYTIAE